MSNVALIREHNYGNGSTSTLTRFLSQHEERLYGRNITHDLADELDLGILVKEIVHEPVRYDDLTAAADDSCSGDDDDDENDDDDDPETATDLVPEFTSPVGTISCYVTAVSTFVSLLHVITKRSTDCRKDQLRPNAWPIVDLV